MEENTKVVSGQKERIGEICIADEVVAVIAALAALEVEGVDSMAGNITNDLVGKLGMKKLSRGVKVDVTEHPLQLQYPGSERKGSGARYRRDREHDRT